MADAIMRAGTEMSAIVPEIWSAKTYETLLAELPFSMVVDRSYEGDIKALGDKVNIHTFPEFDAAVDLAEDGTSEAAALTVATQALTIDQQLTKDFIVTNMALAQSLPAMAKVS